MGSYSYLQNTNKLIKDNRVLLASKLKELGYNITVMETGYGDSNLDELLSVLDENGIDAMLTDKSWSNDPKDSKNYALVAVSTSNFQRFEAEFEDSKAIKPGDENSSVYWYGTAVGANNKQLPARIGASEEDKEASYGYTWKCSPTLNKEGFAYTDITYRWLNKQGKAVKLCDEVRIFNTHKEKDNDSLYVKFRIKLSKISQQTAKDNALLSFTPTGYLGKPIELDVAAELPERVNRVYTYADYLAQGSPEGYFDLEYSISYTDLRENKILTGDIDYNPYSEDSWWWLVMRGVSPRLYWHGNCDLSLDYMELEDQMHRNLRKQPALYKTKINQRLRDFVNLPHGDVIKHFYTMDEPFQPNLNSFKELQAMVEDDLPSPISTIYDIKHREFPMSDGVNYFDHVDLARNVVKPPIIMSDIYPIKPGISFNPGVGNFVQDVFDYRLTKNYRECKTYTLAEKGRKFYPVVQSFGYWDTKQWLSWAQPPRATQRALLYLPLCYQPDGIINYRMFGFVQKSGAGEYASVKAMPDGSVVDNSYIWDVIKHINPRVKYYGTLLKDWTWLGANTAMPKNLNLSSDFARSGINSVSVTKTGKGKYKGYIECGYYLDKEGQGAVFAVNRRGDFFTGTKKEAIKNSDLVPPDKYDDYYQEFPSQSLVVRLPKESSSSFHALFDPLDNFLVAGKKNVIEVELTAGEGRLLRLVDTLPAVVKKGRCNIGKHAYLQGKVVLSNKAEVVCDGDIVLLPGCSLILKKGSKLKVNGTIVKTDNNTIINEGELLSN